ncbi:cytochrome c oxidase assembly protein subunit 15 [Salegentibacter sp. 24]|uniref:COX15/CtaA family protein n=1 Tax=Salegentibacter sp. 24 TaxID=2183986 RepID=UPI00105B6DF0|nr:COX15/CtaA family protein [Salegentibacter sp. 24]TDN88747.1 cytochrome c oxidase assembly protein subunit 15 [Salegentibacter sp. 24]
MYRKSVKVSLILVYLVIVAGAVVRMTGSGMGCPDWPKCFGYYIPPTEISELRFQANREYEKGQVIIVDKTLKVAATDFTSSKKYSPENWETYTKHDYAIFNPAHTWVEYINRLAGAIAGFAVLIMAFLSLKKWKKRKRITVLSWLSVLLMGFQAWLGATVVYSVLSPLRITIHMVMALVIVALLLYLLFIAEEKAKNKVPDRSFRNLMILAVAFTLIQVVLGTQVRQLVDEQVKLLGYQAKDLWLAHPDLNFYIHRSFSILVLIVNVALWWKNKKLQLQFDKINWVLLLIFLEIITGIAMYNFEFPFASQPLHLVIASVLFGFQFYLLLESFAAGRKLKTL